MNSDLKIIERNNNSSSMEASKTDEELVETNNNSHHIHLEKLVKIGVQESRIIEGMEKYLNGDSTNWKCSQNHLGQTYFDVKFLPEDLSKKFNDSLSEDLSPLTPLEPLNGLKIINLLHAYQIGYKDHLYHYRHFPDKKCRMYAQKHSVLLTCIDMYLRNNGQKGTLKWLFQALKYLKIKYYTNPDSFRRKLREILPKKTETDENTSFQLKPLSFHIIHKNTTKPNKSRLKVTRWHKFKAMDLMAEGCLKTTILEKINEGKKANQKISYSTLLRLITNEMKNLTAEDRYGYDFFKANLEPYIRRRKPEYKLQVVEADGTRFQIPYYDKNEKFPRFLVIYVIIDVYSSMILGYSIGKTENTKMIIDAFHMMLEVHGYMPACVIVDKSSPHQSEEFKNFKSFSNKFYNTLWNEHLPDYPNAKGTVENFNLNFNVQIVRNLPNYLGLSMHAKSSNHKLRRDKYKKAVKNRKKLLSEDELKHLISTAINKWNQRITKDRSPEQKNNLGEVLDAKSIKEEHIAKLCWNSMDRKVRRSRVIINQLEYMIEKNKNRAEWNNLIVQVYYHSNHPEHVFIFKDDKFIEKCRLKRFYTESDGSKFHQIEKNKRFRTYCKAKVSENQNDLEKEEVINSIFPVITGSKDEANEAYEKFLHEEWEGDVPPSENPDVNALPVPKL